MDKVFTSSSGSTSLLPQQTITVLYAGQRTRTTANGQQRLITNGARKLAPNHQEAPWGPSSRTPLLTTVLNYTGVPFHALSLALPRDGKPLLLCVSISRWLVSTLVGNGKQPTDTFNLSPHLYRAAIAIGGQAGVPDFIQSNISLSSIAAPHAGTNHQWSLRRQNTVAHFPSCFTRTLLITRHPFSPDQIFSHWLHLSLKCEMSSPSFIFWDTCSEWIYFSLSWTVCKLWLGVSDNLIVKVLSSVGPFKGFTHVLIFLGHLESSPVFFSLLPRHILKSNAIKHVL